MVPLFIGINSHVYDFSQTNMSFKEDDLKPDLHSLDAQTFRLLGESDKFVFDNVYMKPRFDIFFKKWYVETRFSSNLTDIVGNRNFQQIVSLGNKVVPIILNELKNKPSNLVWALNIILNQKISKRPISIAEASKSWVLWGRKAGLVTN